MYALLNVWLWTCDLLSLGSEEPEGILTRFCGLCDYSLDSLGLALLPDGNRSYSSMLGRQTISHDGYLFLVINFKFKP